MRRGWSIQPGGFSDQIPQIFVSACTGWKKSFLASSCKSHSSSLLQSTTRPLTALHTAPEVVLLHSIPRLTWSVCRHVHTWSYSGSQHVRMRLQTENREDLGWKLEWQQLQGPSFYVSSAISSSKLLPPFWLRSHSSTIKLLWYLSKFYCEFSLIFSFFPAFGWILASLQALVGKEERTVF